MNFGEYDEKDLFHIEKSQIYKKLGDGIPTIEFNVKTKEKSNENEKIIYRTHDTFSYHGYVCGPCQCGRPWKGNRGQS